MDDAQATTPDATRHYLDQAATSHPKPPRVWDAFLHQARDLGAPAGRSAYREAVETDRSIENTRLALARLFGARAERVAFTLNATDALNTALKGYLRPGDHVVTTALEHNSVTRPLGRLAAEREVQVTTVEATESGSVEAGRMIDALRPETRLVAMTHASNVTGALLPIDDVSLAAHERGIAFLLDAAQTAGSLPIRLDALPIDLLAVPGHKGLLGPPGTGALILSDRVDVAPLREGGTGFRSEETRQPSELPHALESGTPNAPGIVALGVAVKWIEERGLETIRAELEGLMAAFQEGIDGLCGLTWYGPRDIALREPVYSLRIEGFAPEELALILDTQFGLQVRSGLHCAPGAHRAIGTFPEGTVRFSMGATSTMADVEAAVDALRTITK